ncbi:hypothetical protein IE4803_PD00650 (plasmid) [Rhizobium etli bv. phaseoli str. IE4803]|nr:hypothetical protein IE4803_PD00650 [Rhizobium etli bv. phaseoli str. IE4803]
MSGWQGALRQPRLSGNQACIHGGKKGNPFTLQQFGTGSRPLRRPINNRNRSRHVVVQRNPLTAAGSLLLGLPMARPDGAAADPNCVHSRVGTAWVSGQIGCGHKVGAGVTNCNGVRPA